MKRILTITFYYFLIFHLTCSPTQNNSNDPNANFFGMLMNLLGLNSFQKEQTLSQASTQVTGILRDANGDPLAFAILELSLLQGRSAEGNLTRVTSDTGTKTDADGAYTLKLRLGKFEIGVTKADGTKMGSFSLDVVNSNVPPTVTTTSNTFAVSGVGISSIGSPPPSITSAKLESITYTDNTIYQNITTVITPKIKGGKTTNCRISPSLPIGLSFNPMSCVISGASIITQIPTIYSVVASNQSGSVSTKFILTINLGVPTGLSYTGSPFVFTKDAPIAVITPLFAGVVTSCTASPNLPTGLRIDSSTCAISGIPTVTKAISNYTITAGNKWGSITTEIVVTVNFAPPTGLSYNGSPYVFTKDFPIPAINPSYSGTITTCAINPSLPSGMELNTTTCVISGTPNSIQSPTLHTITASNNGGSVSTDINITVNYSAPTGLSYSGSPYIFTKDALISPQTPTFSGTVTSCTTNPPFPSGLNINSNTCVISGVPTVISSATNYSVTASNNGGSVSTSINITVNYSAPSGLSYSGSPYVFTQNAPVSRTLTYSGTITSCSISPALPSGMGYSNTCVISGTPTVVQSATNYTVTASNNGGSVSTIVIITVNIAPPSGLSYSGSPFVFTRDVLISPRTPTFSGTVTNCTISPSLPTGLGINSTNCVISGTPTVIQSATSYTVTASNNGGSVSTGITITVNYAAPTGLSYSGSPFVFTKDALISPITPNFSGTVTSCTISPTLPSGLGINSTTCVISGTPTVIRSATNYIVTAGNNGGSVSTSITITVNYVAPTGLSYSGSPYVFTKDALISSKTPIYSGTVTSCTTTPSLPSGLGINSTTCVISGTPTVVQSATNYTVTASNNGGSVSTGITITVNYAAPTGLSYSGGPYVFTKDALISSKTPTFSGTVTSCTISPNLPTGLGINSTTCAISGTPTEIQLATSYTVTASNNGGSVSTSITITINYAAPSGLSYSGSPFIFTKDLLISSQTPTFSGTVTSCTISPNLPTGLGINSTTCAISGTPTEIQLATSYTVTASNNGGSVSTSITITINYAAPAGLRYSGSPFIFTKDLLISSQTPTYSGTVTSCTISPSLPTGLGINSTTCVISGTPTVIQSATNYTVTASNNGGSVSTSTTITVNYAAPSGLSYGGSPYVFTKDALISSKIPTFSGTVTNCTISPSLPTGLGINSTTCIISGTPTVVQSAINYTVTASNNGGSASTIIAISINYAAPTGLIYIGNPYILTKDYISSLVPTFTGTVTSCTISPSLPTGLDINTNTCVISGTPAMIQSSSSYVITGSNNGGGVSTSITIEISSLDNQLNLIVTTPVGLLKTGQKTKYLNTTGEDADYQKGIARTFTVGINTGLLWQRCSGGQNYDTACSGTVKTYTWDQANSYCTNLSLGGKTWRLPTLSELSLLIDYGKLPPIDNIAFPSLPSGSYHWTSTFNNNNTTDMMMVGSDLGYITYGPKSMAGYVRCVSGVKQDRQPLVNNGDRTVTDKSTNLIWQRCNANYDGDACGTGFSPTEFTLLDAISYCEKLVIGGRSDWRVPNINELLSIVDYTKSTTRSIDTAAFPNSYYGYDNWSSTTFVYSTLNAWGINFYVGSTMNSSNTTKRSVRCVAGP